VGEHRGVATAASLALVCGVALGGATGCHRKAPDPIARPGPAAAPALPVPPVDSLLPGELAEGKEKAYGLPLPRRMVAHYFPSEVTAIGDVPAEDVANFVRARVLAEHVETGPSKTVFTHVTPKVDPERMLRIEVIRRGSRTELHVIDDAHPLPKPGLTEEERWKEVGLKPDGTVLDPTHLE
jgi:hypothetical protein